MQSIETAQELPNPMDDFEKVLRDLKIEAISQAGQLDFLLADENIRRAQIRLFAAENEKLVMRIRQLETQYEMLILENRKEEKK